MQYAIDSVNGGGGGATNNMIIEESSMPFSISSTVLVISFYNNHWGESFAHHNVFQNKSQSFFLQCMGKYHIFLVSRLYATWILLAFVQRENQSMPFAIKDQHAIKFNP